MFHGFGTRIALGNRRWRCKPLSSCYREEGLLGYKNCRDQWRQRECCCLHSSQQKALYGALIQKIVKKLRVWTRNLLKIPTRFKNSYIENKILLKNVHFTIYNQKPIVQYYSTIQTVKQSMNILENSKTIDFFNDQFSIHSTKSLK